MPATTASFLLLAMGLLGATDIALYHRRAHRLHERPEAVPELVTHALRGPTYAVLFSAVPNLVVTGWWAVALLGVLAFDLAISVADFWLEPDTRRPQGGLPRGEYLLHIVLAMLFGALVAVLGPPLVEAAREPTAIAWREQGVPLALRVVLWVMAPCVLLSGLSDLLAIRRLRRTAA